MAERENNAQYYLRKHKILELLDNMTAALVHSRPDDPKGFMIEYIKKLIEAKTLKLNYPSLFDGDNIRSLYGMLDTVGKGYVNHAQYKEAMENVGAKDYERNPKGTENDQITLETFTEEMRQGLQNASATFTN